MCSHWGMGSGGSEKEDTIIELNLEGWVGFFSQRKEEGALWAEGSVGAKTEKMGTCVPKSI